MATIGQYKGTDIIGGTQDYVNQQIRNIDALATKPNIPPTTPPTSAKDISGNFPSFNMPNIPTTYTPIDSAIATTAGEKEYVSRVQKEQEAAFQRAQQQTEADRGILSTILSNKPDRKAIISEAESELDTSRAEMLNQINSVIKEVDSLNEAYNKEKERSDLFINQLEENKAGVFGPGVLNSFLTRAEKDQAVKLNALAAGINAKTATVEALRGNYKLANDYIQQAVDAETAQYKDDVDALLLYRDFNNDAFERIDSVYRDAYEAEITIAQNRLNDEREKSMAKYKAGLAASTSSLGGYTDQEKRKLRAAGIDPDDVESADEYLYGGGTRAPKDDTELQTLLDVIIDDGSDDAISGTYEIGGKDFRLSSEQQEQYRDLIEAQSSRLYKTSNLPGIKQAVDIWGYFFD